MRKNLFYSTILKSKAGRLVSAKLSEVEQEGGGGEDPEDPPPAEGLTFITTIAVDSTSESDQTDMFIEFGLPLKKGTIASNEHIVVYDDELALSTQDDGRSTDRGGDIRFLRGCCILPSLTAGATKVLTIYKTAGAPTTGPTKTVSQLLAIDTDADCDFYCDDDLEQWSVNFRDAATASTTWVHGASAAHCRGFFCDGPLRKTIVCMDYMRNSEGEAHPQGFVEFYATAYSTDNFVSDIRWNFEPIWQCYWADIERQRDLHGAVTITTGIASPLTVADHPTKYPACDLVISSGRVMTTSPTTNGTFDINDHGKIVSDTHNMARGIINGIGANGASANTMPFPTGPNLVSNNLFVSSSLGWTLDANITHGSQRLNWSGDQTTTASVRQEIPLLVEGVQYECSFKATRSAGTVTISLGGTAGTPRSSAATFTEILTCGSGAKEVVLTGDADFIGSIDNVNVGIAFDAGTRAEGDWKIPGMQVKKGGCIWWEHIWHGTQPKYDVRPERDYLFNSRLLPPYQQPSNYYDESSIITANNNLLAFGTYPTPVKSSGQHYMHGRFMQGNEPEGHLIETSQLYSLRKMENDVGPHIAKISLPRIYTTAKSWAQKDGPWTMDDYTGVLVNGGVTMPGSRDRAAMIDGADNYPDKPVVPPSLDGGLLPAVGIHHHEGYPYIPYLITGKLFWLKRMYVDVFLFYLTVVSFNNAGLSRPIWSTNQERTVSWGERILTETAVISPDDMARGIIGWSKNDVMTWSENAWNKAYSDFIDDGSGHPGWLVWGPTNPDYPGINQPFYRHCGSTANNPMQPGAANFHVMFMASYKCFAAGHMEELDMFTENGRKLYRRIVAHMANMFANSAITVSPRTLICGRGNFVIGENRPVSEGGIGTSSDWDEIAHYIEQVGGLDNGPNYGSKTWAGLIYGRDTGIFEDTDLLNEAIAIHVEYLRGTGVDPTGTDPLILTPQKTSGTNYAREWWIATRTD